MTAAISLRAVRGRRTPQSIATGHTVTATARVLLRNFLHLNGISDPSGKGFHVADRLFARAPGRGAADGLQRGAVRYHAGFPWESSSGSRTTLKL